MKQITISITHVSIKRIILNFRLENRFAENRITADEVKLTGLHVDKSNENHGQQPTLSPDLQGEE